MKYHVSSLSLDSSVLQRDTIFYYLVEVM